MRFLIFSAFVCNDEMKTMTCKSKKHKLKHCEIGGGKKITGVAVDKVFSMSMATCIYHDNPPPSGYKMGDLGIFGWTPDEVWVHRGCAAKFLVCYKGDYIQQTKCSASLLLTKLDRSKCNTPDWIT